MDSLVLCPDCDSEMLLGALRTHTGAAARVLLGEHGLASRIMFVAEETGEQIELGGSVAAYRCAKCKTVAIPGDDGHADSLACFECEAAIPADATACPKCGWTW